MDNNRDKVFKALADPIRRRLLDRVRDKQGLTLNELCQELAISRQAVTKHLALLEGANLLVSVRNGRTKLHYLNPAPITEICRRWFGRFEQEGCLTAVSLEEQDAMKTANERLTHLLESITDAYVALDSDWRFLAVNPAAERLVFKRPAAELIGKVYWEEYPESDQGEFARHCRLAVTENRPVHFEAYSSIGQRWFETHVYPLDGQVEVYFRDITERKGAERRLRRSEYTLAEAQRIARIGSWELNVPSRSITWSAELCRIFGVEPGAAGLSYESFLQRVHPDDRKRADDLFRKAFDDLEPFDFHYRIVLPDRSVRSLHSQGRVIEGADGKPTAMIGTSQDVTEAMRKEEELRISEKKFSTVFHSAPALISITTLAEGRYVDVNEAFLQTLGYRRDEVIGRTAHDMAWEDPDERGRIVGELLARGTVKNLECRFRCKSGSIFVGLLSAEVIDFYGERYVLGLVKDITERKTMEEEIEVLHTSLAARAMELESANKNLAAFNYTVSHDLRRPLTVLNGYCQLVTDECGDRLDETCTGYLRQIHNGTLEMAGLIDALLKFSNLSQMELTSEPVDLTRMATIIASELRMMEPERPVSFVIAEGVTASGDGQLLRLVLENLLGNAWKYTANRGECRIEFGVAAIAGEKAFFVRDDGPGFDMAHAVRMFAPFQRLPDSGGFQGHGIGLATVKRIVERHDGTVWAVGEKGKGATFYFTLKGN